MAVGANHYVSLYMYHREKKLHSLFYAGDVR